MLDLALRLVDRLIDLSKRREAVNRAQFVDFVEPAFQSFEKVHTDYIDSLTRYSARLADLSMRMDLKHPIFGEMELDSLKSEHLRAKLKEFKPDTAPVKLRDFLSAIDFYLKGMSASAAHAAVIGKLVHAGDAGLSGAELGSLEPERNRDERARADAATRILIFSDPMREALRQMLLGYDAPSDLGEEEGAALSEGAQNLSLLRDEDRRQMCAAAVRNAMMHFQGCYSSVAAAHAKLRSELLTPR